MPALDEAPLRYPEASKILTDAVLRAADKLGVPGSGLAEIVGVSAATLSRIKSGNYQLNPRKKEFELSVLFVRLFRSLDAIVGGDDRVATEEKRAWKRWPVTRRRALTKAE